MIINYIAKEEAPDLDNWCAQHRTFQLFDPAMKCSVNRLNPELTIGGVTKTPMFRYKGGDASSSGWAKWTYGEDLDFVSSGTDPTYNDGSPGFETEDDSVKFNAGDYFKADNTTFGNIGTNDFVLEIIFQTDGLSTSRQFLDKRNGSAEGWRAGHSTSQGYLSLEDSSSNAATISTGTLTANTWYHALLFVDKSENSTNGAKWYVNGVASGTGVNCSSIGSIDSTKYVYAAERQDGTQHCNNRIAYLAMWKGSAWMQGGSTNGTEWAAIAEERFAKWSGRYPSVAHGTVTPTLKTRAFEAYLDKIESGKTVLYYVGDEWLRQCHRQDANGEDVYGYLSEYQGTNLITQSEDFSTTWTKIDSGDTITTDAVACPDKRVVADALKADSTDGQHGVSISASMTVADRHAFSVYAKPGNQNWIKIEDTTVSNCYAYFNISTGVVGSTPGSGLSEAYISSEHYNGFYRVSIVYTGTIASHTMRILSANADNDDTFAGDGSTINTYLWGAQLEFADYPTSHIITAGSTATRLTDTLAFKGDDGNITNNQIGMCLFDWLSADKKFTGEPRVTSYPITLSDGGSADDMITAYMHTTGESPQYRVSGAATTKIIGLSMDIADGEKKDFQLKWSSTKIEMIVNGSSTSDTTGFVVPNDLDKIHVGNNRTDNYNSRALVANIQLCDEVLD
jgi:hypothetical protein